ncbi:MAG: hypothetical protein ACRCZI_13145 [Cetobacterium sp.]
MNNIKSIMTDSQVNNEKFENDDLHHINIVIPKNERITADKFTSFEYTRVIEERAKEIENGSMIFVDIKDETDPIKIAEMEIIQRKSPKTIIRHLNKNVVEKWSANELIRN